MTHEERASNALLPSIGWRCPLDGWKLQVQQGTGRQRLRVEDLQPPQPQTYMNARAHAARRAHATDGIVPRPLAGALRGPGAAILVKSISTKFPGDFGPVTRSENPRRGKGVNYFKWKIYK